MIDKWFRDDIEKVLKTNNRVVIAAEDENADFLYDLIPDKYKVFKPKNDIDELKTKYEIEKHFPNQKVVIFSESSRSKLNFLREYCETCGCIDIKFLHNYVKDKVHSQLKFNLQLTPDETITAAKVSRGKDKDYWMDIVHKGKTRIIDIGHEILPFLNDPEGYCKGIDTQVKKAFFARVNEWLGNENIDQPPVTLAGEAAAKILGSLVKGDGEKKFKETYQKWADSKKFEASLDRYIAETPLTFDEDVWDVDASHPFQAIDRKWLNDISRNLADKRFVQKKIDIIKRRASNKTGKKVFETLWDDILTLLEFEPIRISSLNSFEATLQFYVDEFYKLDSAIRRLYAKFIHETDMIRPIQEYYNGILVQLLDKWHRHFKKYAENQSNTLFDILENAEGTYAIIVGDGVTFEISKIISEKLQNRYVVTVSYKLAGFPSTTENNMSNIYVGPDKLEKVHKKREEGLRKKCDSEINFLPLEKVNYSTDTGNHLICAYGDIDDIAEKLQQNALKYITQMEDELAEKIDRLIKCGYETVYLTSDHGFVLTGLLSESDKIEFDFKGEHAKSERYVRTVEKQKKSDQFVEIQKSYDAFHYVYFHKSNRPFKTPGKYGYSHGGISPQELIVPFLCIKKKAASFEKLKVRISNKEDLKGVVGENFEISLKTDVQTDFFSMSRKIMMLFLSEGKKVNQSDIITMEADEIIKKEYGFDHHTALEIVLVDAETRETLDKAAIKRAATRDMGGLL